MFNIFLFCFFFLAATCTGEQQSKFFVLLQLLSLQPPLPSLMCLGESVSVHFEMTDVCDSAQMIEGVQMSEKTELGLPSWLFIFDLSEGKYYVPQGWLLDSSEVVIIRKESNTESKDYEDLIMRTLLQKGEDSLMKLSAAEVFDQKSKLSC